MIRYLRTLFLVVALAVPSLSTPAHANDDLKKFLAALAVMGIIGVIAERERDNPTVAPVVPTPPRKPHRRWKDHSKQLPHECFKSYRTSGGKNSYFGEKCLKKKYKYAKHLPKSCQRNVWIKGRNRVLYSPNCLQYRGYQTHHRDD